MLSTELWWLPFLSDDVVVCSFSELSPNRSHDRGVEGFFAASIERLQDRTPAHIVTSRTRLMRELVCAVRAQSYNNSGDMQQGIVILAISDAPRVSQSSFQQALYRNVTENNAQLEKRLDNVIREANGEISLLTNKIKEVERDLDGERRKANSLQESLKESEKEYHKLKTQYDKLKRKALLGGPVGGGSGSKDGPVPLTNQMLNIPSRQEDSARLRQGAAYGVGVPGRVDVGAVVGNMEAAGIQRTPIVNRTMPMLGVPQASGAASWRHPQPTQARGRATTGQRQPFGAVDTSYRNSASTTRSDHSDNTADIENLLTQPARHGHRSASLNVPGSNPQWSGHAQAQRTSNSAAGAPRVRLSPSGNPASKRSGPKFKPAGFHAPMG
ncbi:uncharacterized protein BXZ73DRAFT_74083 [Epithele typhae]|uniref:uncharacterized protein n=1 Tax=Epithele typhae TaxID=378194 RepID=UPI0020084580|nr:uncharacterized protein BXZ73DRAFT_74083 [Epithele typhae]KAH9943019.1 hypothetical protein BXZ73DRAFT_74083 [Epithele typhae]